MGMAENKEQAEYSLWLMPDEDDAAWLDALIASAAPSFGTPPFRAHLTIQGDLAWPPEKLRRVAETLALSCPALDWPMAGVECSAHYFRSLFVRLQSNGAFASLRSTAARLTESELGLSPFPHVSLAYGEPQQPEDKRVFQAGFAARLSEKRTLRIDTLALALSAKNLPIGQWRVLEALPLRSR
jgi:hypothetical protein